MGLFVSGPRRQLLAADGALDRYRAAWVGDDRSDRGLATVGAAILGPVHGTVADVTDDLAALRLARRGGETRTLTTRIGRALEEQTSVSHKQVESVEEIRQMISRLDETVAEHGEGTAKVLKELGQLVHLADEDQRAVTELAFAAQALTRHAQALRDGLQQFRM